MGLILLVTLFPACVVLVAKRRRRRVTIVVPLVLALGSLVCAGLSLVGMVHAFAGLAGVDPPLKATLLAKGISELMNEAMLGFLIAVPLLLGAWLLDRTFRS